jgi:hypothetical protein
VKEELDVTHHRLVTATLFSSTVVLSVLLVVSSVATAGPSGSPNFGVTDPLDANPTTYSQPPQGPVFTGSCPWPNVVDAALPEVGKCLPTNIAWSEDGVRVVSDPLVDAGDVVRGQFTFWCQARMGLRFLVTVQGLDPSTVYPVTSDLFGTIATLRTDRDGNGVVGGIVALEPGGYETTIAVGTALTTRADDPIGFEVF